MRPLGQIESPWAGKVSENFTIWSQTIDPRGAALSHTAPRCISFASASTSAIIASATGAARIPTHGSWRPLVTIVGRVARGW